MANDTNAEHNPLTAVLVGGPQHAQAQWVNHPTPSAPRTQEGRVNLNAKTPRLRSGKPDLSGIWQIEDPTREERYQFFFDGINNLGEDVPAKYFMNLLYDFKSDDGLMRPQTAAIAQRHFAGRAKEIPSTRCLPFGVPLMDAAPFPMKLMQMTGEIVLLYEHPPPSWLGSSVGRWDGDTLVVETIGFNDQGWLDAFGHPHSDEMRVTERFQRKDFGHMDLSVTVTDLKMYTRPFTVTLHQRLRPDTDLLEDICTENEKDWQHMPK